MAATTKKLAKVINANAASAADAAHADALQHSDGPAPKRAKPSISTDEGSAMTSDPQCHDISECELADLYERNFAKVCDDAAFNSSDAPSDEFFESPSKCARLQND